MQRLPVTYKEKAILWVAFFFFTARCVEKIKSLPTFTGCLLLKPCILIAYFLSWYEI